jgi:ATP-dependent Clp protease adapter protein ClpS
MEALIVSAVSQDPMVRIHLIADRNTPYKYVDEAVKQWLVIPE